MITLEQAKKLKKGQHLLAFYQGGNSQKGRWVDCLLNDIHIDHYGSPISAYVYLYPNEEESPIESEYGGHTLIELKNIRLPGKAKVEEIIHQLKEQLYEN